MTPNESIEDEALPIHPEAGPDQPMEPGNDGPDPDDDD